MPLPLVPIVLSSVAVALAAAVISYSLHKGILSHLDNTAASEEYSKQMLERAQRIEDLHKQFPTASLTEIERAAGPTPAKPKQMGMSWGLPAALIGLGAAAVGVAIFWPKLKGIFFRRAAA